MKKIVFVGGGSCKFVRELTADLFTFPALEDLQFTVMDIHRERGERSVRLLQRMIAERGMAATVEFEGDRRRALEGADYVIITIMVGGFDHYHSDVEIPARYGIYQTVSDTIGPGGVFRTVRTAPVLQGLAQDLRAVAPDAWVLNYANPMAMNVWTLEGCGHQRVVGLCHSIQYCHRVISGWLGLPPEDVRYTAAGINHINFYLTLLHQGRDLYPELLARQDEIVRREPGELARFELLRYLGHFPAEGPAHQSEYYPWFRKTPEMVEHYAAPTYWGYNVDSQMFEERAREIEDQIAGRTPISYARSLEFGAHIINALEGGDQCTIYGSVRNRGLIANLPAQAVVEVPCLVDGNGIFPCAMGTIPPQLAAVMQPHIAVHEMAVRGALEHDRTLIRQAIQADPLTGAILTLPRIECLVDDLFEANRDYWKD